MPAFILDGRKTRDELFPKLIERIGKLSRVPTLAIIQVGNQPDSTAFIRAKQIFAKKIGIETKYIQAAEDITREELIKIVRECNADDSIRGIIVQLPLPTHISSDLIIRSIDPKKDADGLTPYNVKRWSEGVNDPNAIWPATSRGIRELFDFYDIRLIGEKIIVIGRSKLVGAPIAAMCRNEGASVTVCHSKTVNLEEETKKADILIVATGKRGLITARHVREGQVIIDVGISKDGEGKLNGDVDFEGVKDIVAAISPVPGGVGPMTVMALFENLIDLCN